MCNVPKYNNLVSLFTNPVFSRIVMQHGNRFFFDFLQLAYISKNVEGIKVYFSELAPFHTGPNVYGNVRRNTSQVRATINDLRKTAQRQTMTATDVRFAGAIFCTFLPKFSYSQKLILKSRDIQSSTKFQEIAASFPNLLRLRAENLFTTQPVCVFFGIFVVLVFF